MEKSFNIQIGDFQFDISASEAKSLDIKQISETRYHLIYNAKTYTIEVPPGKLSRKNMPLKFDANQYDIKIGDEYDQLIDDLGFSANHHTSIKDIKAPMPGLVLETMVTPEQQIGVDEPLLTLEAMKMENVIKSTGDAVVKAVHVKKGDSVEKD